MSRTYRKEGPKAHGKRLKPYTKDSRPPKWETPSYEGYNDNGQYGRPTKEMKEEIRNANRSLKKGKRQQLKTQMQEEIAVYQETKIGDTILNKNDNSTYTASIQDADDMNWIIKENEGD